MERTWEGWSPMSRQLGQRRNGKQQGRAGRRGGEGTGVGADLERKNLTDGWREEAGGENGLRNSDDGAEQRWEGRRQRGAELRREGQRAKGARRGARKAEGGGALTNMEERRGPRQYG